MAEEEGSPDLVTVEQSRSWLAVGAVLAYGAIRWARARRPAAKAAAAT